MATSHPSKARLKAGMVCIVLNYVLGWPFLLAIETAAAVYQSRTLALMGPAVYAFSWLLLGVGLWLAGPQAISLTKGFIRRLLKRKEDNAP